MSDINQTVYMKKKSVSWKMLLLAGLFFIAYVYGQDDLSGIQATGILLLLAMIYYLYWLLWARKVALALAQWPIAILAIIIFFFWLIFPYTWAGVFVFSTVLAGQSFAVIKGWAVQKSD
jgi:hypothetical protein